MIYIAKGFGLINSFSVILKQYRVVYKFEWILDQKFKKKDSLKIVEKM